ncbi:methyltransferase domain-containing protein [Cyanobium sp. ATX 6F1]|uniref:methyltransferase domain-containing protein n=1 Tax=unclassified Cyanobium TaxID=2627006 RepID=UPI0020CC6806|nr:methyltransferase domain-containing protein [Cyanobium sp. ATX 6F1]MCP9917467.1 methyltransferase domain-containing protein [Cyanobium sp. ATX 6F1]
MNETLLTWREFEVYSQRMLAATRAACSAYREIISIGEFEFYCTSCRALVKAKPTTDWNLRNCILCPQCGLSGRERHLLDNLKSLSKNMRSSNISIACFESITQFADVIRKLYPGAHMSEFIDQNAKPGSIQIIEVLRAECIHQDITNTSHEDSSIQIIIHRDVYEHIPNIKSALKEAHRILASNGYMIFTMPLYDRQQTVSRCEIIDGTLRHHLPEAYHGNPLSPDGSLVFTDPGIDFFETCESSGFAIELFLGLDIAKGYFPDCNPYDIYHSWNLCFILRKA